MKDQHWLWKPKFILATAIFIVGSLGLWHIPQLVSEAVWRDLMIALYGGFAIASVIENKVLK